MRDKNNPEIKFSNASDFRYPKRFSNWPNKFCVAGLVSILCLAGLPATAQTSCDGLWRATYLDEEKNWLTTADVQIKGQAGYWMAHLGRHDLEGSPCREKWFPITVLACSETHLEFQVDGSSVQSPRGDHCPNWHIRVAREDERQAKGLFLRQKIPVKLERQSSN